MVYSKLIYNTKIPWLPTRLNAYYYALEKILSSRLLSKKLQVNTYKTTILQVVLYGCETRSLTSREEGSRGLGCSRIKYLERYLGLKEKILPHSGESYIILS